MANEKEEAFQGLGKTERRRMKKRWKEETAKSEKGGATSLKEWAKKGEVGDAAVAWLEHKRGGSGS